MTNIFDPIGTFLVDERWLTEGSTPNSLTPDLPSLIQGQEQMESVNGQTLEAITLLNQFPHMPCNVPPTKQTRSLERERKTPLPLANTQN